MNWKDFLKAFKMLTYEKLKTLEVKIKDSKFIN